MTTIKSIDINAILNLVNNGAITLEQIKDFVLKVKEIFDSLVQTVSNIQPTVQSLNLQGAVYTDLANKPVSLNDLNNWVPSGQFLSNEDVKNYGSQMAKAISQEKWAEGFAFAIQLLATLGAI